MGSICFDDFPLGMGVRAFAKNNVNCEEQSMKSVAGGLRAGGVKPTSQRRGPEGVGQASRLSTDNPASHGPYRFVGKRPL